jgi:hypothetical protein
MWGKPLNSRRLWDDELSFGQWRPRAVSVENDPQRSKSALHGSPETGHSLVACLARRYDRGLSAAPTAFLNEMPEVPA